MANLWNPLYLPYGSLTNWYDSTDTTTLTLSTNDTVADWRDKSYKANNLSEADFADLPVYGTTNINGLSTIDFDDGAAINLDIPETSIESPFYILFAGFQNDNSTTVRSTYFDISNTSDVDRLVLRLTGDGTGSPGANDLSQVLYKETGGTTGFTTINFSGVSAMDDQTVIYTANVTTTSLTAQYNLSETVIDTIPAGFAANEITLGASNNESNGLNGQAGEFIIVQGGITTDDVRKLEGYTAWKWGQEDNLPDGHPYKLAAPTVTDVEFRNKLYETSTEEGSSRFRRLFALGYVG